MAIKTFKPMTNGTRGMSKLVNTEITKDTPEKSLVVTLKKNGGRNNQGKITIKLCQDFTYYVIFFLHSQLN